VPWSWLDDVGDGEAEELEQLAGRGRFAEAVDADDGAFEADVLAPEIADTGLDGDARNTRGSTPSRHAASWRSNTVVDGIDTTRAAMPFAASCVRAASASATSEPVAISTTAGLPSASART
jgi:hypothetical protein